MLGGKDPAGRFRQGTINTPCQGHVIHAERQTYAGSSLAGIRSPQGIAIRTRVARRRSLPRPSGTQAGCGPTAHRSVRKVMSPAAHRYAEGESGPTSVVSTGGGRPLARRPRRLLHAGCPPAVLGLVSRPKSTPVRSRRASSRGEVPHATERCGGGPERHNLSDALSVRDDVG